MNQQNITTLVHSLYQAVDNKDLDFLENNLTSQARFRLGNFPEVVGIKNILEGNKQFFTSIESMSHTIEDIILAPNDSSIVKVCCHGAVDYIRLDGSGHSAMFSTVLTIDDGLISDYLVFADISGL